MQVGSEERRDALDAHLWTYREEGFLPHGTVKDGSPELAADLADGRRRQSQSARRCASSPTVRRFPTWRPIARVVMLFDGNDPEAVDRARAAWKDVKAGGHDATYWQQIERGRWERKA